MHWAFEQATDKAIRIAKHTIGGRLAAGQIVGESGGRHQLVAIVSRSAATLEKSLERPLFAKLKNRADIRGFLETGGSSRLPASISDHGSIYLCNAPGVFDQVTLDETILTIVSSWSKAFLAHLYSLVRPDGRLILPVWNGAPGRTFGRWTKQDLMEFFGVEVEALTGTDFAVVHRTSVVPDTVPSVAGWFIDNATNVLLQQAYLAANEADIKPDYAAAFAVSDPKALKSLGVGALDGRMAQFTSQHCYYVGGISFKAPLLSHIIRTHVSKKEGLRIIDMGGGYGLLAAELALDPTLNGANATCTDISDLNARLAAKLYADLGDHIAGRFTFVCQPAQEFEFEGSYDAISFVGSLLYVPKDRLQATIERAWNAVAPGGVLIVHENIKHPRFTRDYEVMFTVEEIDNLLECFGEIHRYASQYTHTVTKAQAGDKSVFRVVTKG